MKLNGSMVYAPDGTRFDGEKTVDHFQIRDAFHGFEVWLDRPRRVLVNPRGMYTSRYGFETRLGWVQIGFDTPMATSATQKLRYTLRLVVCIYRLVVC